MKKRLFQGVILFFVCLFTATITITKIDAATKTNTLWVPAYRQEKLNWCWNGSTQMVGHYLYEYKTKKSDFKSDLW